MFTNLRRDKSCKESILKKMPKSGLFSSCLCAKLSLTALLKEENLDYGLNGK